MSFLLYNEDGDKMNVQILRLDHQGRGIGYIDNKIVFVPKTLPDEIVDVTITLNKKKYMEANLNKILKKSPKRIESDCKYYDSCGGCALRHISYEDELQYKEEKVRDILKKYGNFNTIVNKIVGSNIEGYRNKITFQINNKIGFYQERTNKIIPIDECKLISENMNRELKKYKNIHLFSHQLIIREGNDILTHFDNYKENIKFKTKKNILDKIGEYTYQISPNSFFQVNKYQTLNLYNKVLDYIKTSNDNVLDLYCGAGTIGIYVSKYAKKVLGVEIVESAIKDAFINKELNKIDNIDFILGDAEIVIKNTSFKPDTIIVDPPRSGLTKSVVDNMIRLNPNKIIYVSCDPITLVRDLSLLSQKYDIKEINPYDMFPRTYHVECVCLLERK